MRLFIIIFVVFLLIAGIGCSGGRDGAPTAPADVPSQAIAGGPSHQLWGLWQFVADPQKGNLDIIELRSGNFHLNALPFLEPPPLINLTLENLKFNGNIIDADIGLRHPFLGLTEFTGFDVCGILITNGTKSGFEDPDLRMAGNGDTHLLNPDGWTRWWNPAEFPHTNTISGYKDGLLGAPDSYAHYNSTLNAYKYFCDKLGPNDALDKISFAMRGMFSAGQKNVRHYTIELGTEGLVFNYAVDACWHFPNGNPPWVAPDDFAPEANRVEAYRISTGEVENTLWAEGGESGGDLKLLIGVYDLYDANLNTVKVESTGNFDSVTSSTPTGGGVGYSTYQINIHEAHPITAGQIDLFVTVQSEATGYEDLLPGKPVCAYFFSSAIVDDEKPEPPLKDIGWPQYYFNSQNHSWNPESHITLPLTEVWSTTLSSNSYRPPAVKGNQLWVTISNGYLRSYSTVDGSFLWEKQIDFVSTPSWWTGCPALLHGDHVITGGSAIWCFKAANGDDVWSFKSGSAFDHAGGIIVGDNIYWRSTHGAFYSVNAITGLGNWSVPAGTYPLFNPGADENYTVYPSDNNVYCYTLSGTYKWTKNIGANHYIPPIFNGGKVYYGAYTYYCTDLATGMDDWSYSISPYQAVEGHCFTGDRLVVTGRWYDGSNTYYRIYCFDLSGSEKWHIDNVFRPIASLTYSDGYVFTVAQVNSSDSYAKLIAIDIQDGSIDDAVGSFNLSWGGLACTNNRLYFVDNNKGLYCYE